MKMPRDLADRFPYIFAGPHIGIGIARGWFDVFVQLCVDIDQTLGDDKRGFHWRQVKEKFGTARFYFAWGEGRSDIRLDAVTESGLHSFASVPSDQVERSAGELARAAEAITGSRCMHCGDFAALNRTDGILVSLCAVHLKAWHRQALPSSGFSPEEDL